MYAYLGEAPVDVRKHFEDTTDSLFPLIQSFYSDAETAPPQTFKALLDHWKIYFKDLLTAARSSCTCFWLFMLAGKSQVVQKCKIATMLHYEQKGKGGVVFVFIFISLTLT